MEARSAWCAFEGRIIRRVMPLVYLLLRLLRLQHPSLSLSFSSQVGCRPPRLRGPGRPTEVLPTNPPPRPLARKGSEGKALGPGPGSPGAGIAGASGAVFTSVSSFLVSIFVRPSAYI